MAKGTGLNLRRHTIEKSFAEGSHRITAEQKAFKRQSLYERRKLKEIAKGLEAVKHGKFDIKLFREKNDVYGEMIDNYNSVAEQLNSMDSEFKRVSTEFAVEGKLESRVRISKSEGAWKTLAHSMNVITENLHRQIDDIKKVSRALEKGDLNQKVSVEMQGEMQEMKESLNETVKNFEVVSAEIIRVSKEMGEHGKLKSRIKNISLTGNWKQLTDSINKANSKMEEQVSEITRVVNLIAQGDFSEKAGIKAEGDVLELMQSVNEIVDNLNKFSAQLDGITEEVGKGNLSVQLKPAEKGSWRKMTGSIEQMISMLNVQIAEVADAVQFIAEGNLEHKASLKAEGRIQNLKDNVNALSENLMNLMNEIKLVSAEIGIKGSLGRKIKTEGKGVWNEVISGMNKMSDNLGVQIKEISKVISAAADGSPVDKMQIQARGEFLHLAEKANKMVDNLEKLNREIKELCKAVGKGFIDKRADEKAFTGNWKKTVENMNNLMKEITVPVKEMKIVLISMSKKDLTKKMTLKAKGEIKEIESAINKTIDEIKKLIAVSRTAEKEVTRFSNDLNENSGEINKSLAEAVDSTTYISGNSINQNSKLDSTAKIASDISRGSKENSEKSLASIKMIGMSADLARKGIKTGEDAAESFKAIDETIKENAETVRQLEENSEKIKQMMVEIAETASKTNAIAFNASIQAARAGESGKKFRETADEIKTLAGGTAGAATEIETLVNSMKKSASKAVKSLEKGVITVNEGSGSADYSLKVLTGIEKDLEIISKNIEKINRQSRLHASESGKIANSIKDSSSISRQFASTAQKTADEIKEQSEEIENMKKSLENISSAAEKLRKETGKFKIVSGKKAKKAGKKSSAKKKKENPARLGKKIDLTKQIQDLEMIYEKAGELSRTDESENNVL